MLVIENDRGELLLEKRPGAGLWGGLWSFPECAPEDVDDRIAGSDFEKGELQLARFRHTFTHFHLDITPVHVKLASRANANRIQSPDRQCWYSPRNPSEIGLTRPVTKLIHLIESEQS